MVALRVDAPLAILAVAFVLPWCCGSFCFLGGSCGVSSSYYSFYWVSSYISVPLVLCALGSGPNALERVRRTIDITGLVIIFAGIVLLAYAFIKVDLFDAILHPNILMKCEIGNAWFTNTSGLLRSTGVGRYGAVAALVAIAGIAHGRWRPIWVIFLLVALSLLISSGARSAFVAFAGSSALMVFFYGGRKPTIIIGTFIAIIIVPILLVTGAHTSILRDCLGLNYGATTATSITPDAAPAEVLSSDATSNPYDSQIEPTLSDSLLPDGTATLSDSLLPDGTATLSDSQSPVVSDELLDSTDSMTTESVPAISFSGRTDVWREGLVLVKKSPFLGFGFHADRIMLEAHIHNAFIHALIQTGALGTLPLIIGFTLAWFLLIKALRNLNTFAKRHRTRIVLAGGMLAFFSLRSIPESSGAFFGIDLLILAPSILYLTIVNDSDDAKVEITSSR